MRAAVDVMGGDNAPAAILKGCWEAAPLLDGDDKVFLVGDEAIIRDGLAASGLDDADKARYKIVATTEVIEMDDSPVEAIRNKPNSSITVMCKLATKGEADVVISAGNTGACVAAAQLRDADAAGREPAGHRGHPADVLRAGRHLRRRGEHRPASRGISSNTRSWPAPTRRPSCGIENPRVGCCRIGEEDAKGTTIVKEARKLMRDEPQINFVGNVEGRDLFKGVVDVVVCDGFVGNIVLKFTEGLAEGLFQTILAELQEFAPTCSSSSSR